jgi:hypothetical protein
LVEASNGFIRLHVCKTSITQTMPVSAAVGASPGPTWITVLESSENLDGWTWENYSPGAFLANRIHENIFYNDNLWNKCAFLIFQISLFCVSLLLSFTLNLTKSSHNSHDTAWVHYLSAIFSVRQSHLSALSLAPPTKSQGIGKMHLISPQDSKYGL